jgi:hypothetical protein
MRSAATASAADTQEAVARSVQQQYSSSAAATSTARRGAEQYADGIEYERQNTTGCSS